jgi:DNA-binding transcriptional ArsR family regulator
MMDHFEMSQSLISHHLADLKEMGLIKDERQGKRVYYSLTEKGKKIADLIFKLEV